MKFGILPPAYWLGVPRIFAVPSSGPSALVSNALKNLRKQKQYEEWGSESAAFKKRSQSEVCPLTRSIGSPPIGMRAAGQRTLC